MFFDQQVTAMFSDQQVTAMFFDQQITAMFSDQQYKIHFDFVPKFSHLFVTNTRTIVNGID